MEFLEVGEKIKRVRKKLNMKQRELQDENITRALISMIEIGKRKPSKKNMESIISKFQKKAQKLNIPFELGLSYFLRNAKDDAQVYCSEILNGTVSMGQIMDVIEIANKYELSRILGDTYLKLADKRFENLDYINSQVDYINALENCKNINLNDKIPYIYNMLGRCCINQAQNIQALNYFNFAYHYSILYCDDEIKKKAVYNIALCNKKLDKIEDALTYIDIYVSICDKEKDFLVYSYANILKANCYDCQGQVDRSVEVLNKLLKEFSNNAHPLIGYIYNDLGLLYFKQGCFEKSLECFNVSQAIRTEKDMQHLSHTLIEKSILYVQKNLYTEAINLIKSAINLAKKYNDIEYILRGYYELIKIYKLLKSDEEIQDNYIEILNLLTSNNLESYRDEIIKVCIELMRISLSHSDIEQSIKVLGKLENIYGE